MKKPSISDLEHAAHWLAAFEDEEDGEASKACQRVAAWLRTRALDIVTEEGAIDEIVRVSRTMGAPVSRDAARTWWRRNRG